MNTVGKSEATQFTPLMLTRKRLLPNRETIQASASHHDRDTATVGTHMTVVTTSGGNPEMRDQESDTRPDH